MRVLIVKTSSMGDVVHALPAVSDMANAVPGIEIDWLVERSFAAIPSQHRAVRRVITLQWRKWRQSLGAPQTRAAIQSWRQDMRETPYDLIIDMQGLVKSAAFGCFARGPLGGYDRHSIREPLASLFYRRKAHVSRELHAVIRCRKLAASLLGYATPDAAPDFGLKASPQAWAPGPGPFCVLIPCASRPEKLWPQEAWVRVGQALKAGGWNVAVMWGSSEEQRVAQAIADRIGGTVPPFLSVQEVADSLAKSALTVGLDTGMTHIAAAHGRPTVGIYCDHDPGLAGLTGSGPVVSLGGKGLRPTTASVLSAIDAVMKPSA